MIYTEDRKKFEDQFFKPPFLARMLERTGKYIDGLDDKDAFLALVHEEFWDLRDKIKDSNDVLVKWEMALEYAARSRPCWLVHCGAALEQTKWVRGSRLGRN